MDKTVSINVELKLDSKEFSRKVDGLSKDFKPLNVPIAVNATNSSASTSGNTRVTSLDTTTLSSIRSGFQGSTIALSNELKGAISKTTSDLVKQTEETNKAVRDLKPTALGGLASAITAPLKEISRGAFLTIGSQVTQNLAVGLSKGIEGQLTKDIGSFRLLGEKLITKGIPKLADTRMGQAFDLVANSGAAQKAAANLNKFLGEILDEKDVITAAQAQKQRATDEQKNNQNLAKQNLGAALSTSVKRDEERPKIVEGIKKQIQQAEIEVQQATKEIEQQKAKAQIQKQTRIAPIALTATNEEIQSILDEPEDAVIKAQAKLSEASLKKVQLQGKLSGVKESNLTERILNTARTVGVDTRKIDDIENVIAVSRQKQSTFQKSAEVGTKTYQNIIKDLRKQIQEAEKQRTELLQEAQIYLQLGDDASAKIALTKRDLLKKQIAIIRNQEIPKFKANISENIKSSKEVSSEFEKQRAILESDLSEAISRLATELAKVEDTSPRVRKKRKSVSKKTSKVKSEEVAPQAETVEAEQVKQAVQPTPITDLPEVYKSIVGKVAQISGINLNEENIPKIIADPNLSSSAAYKPSENTIKLRTSDYEALASDKSNLPQELVDSLVHEIRHAVQHNFGKDLTGQAVPLMSPSVEQSQKLSPQIEGSVFYATNRKKKSPEQVESIRKIEADAYTFTDKYYQEIYNSITGINKAIPSLKLKLTERQKEVKSAYQKSQQQLFDSLTSENKAALEQMTGAQLKAIAKSSGISNYSNKKVTELRNLLLDKVNPDELAFKIPLFSKVNPQVQQDAKELTQLAPEEVKSQVKELSAHFRKATAQAGKQGDAQALRQVLDGISEARNVYAAALAGEVDKETRTFLQSALASLGKQRIAAQSRLSVLDANRLNASASATTRSSAAQNVAISDDELAAFYPKADIGIAGMRLAARIAERRAKRAGVKPPNPNLGSVASEQSQQNFSQAEADIVRRIALFESGLKQAESTSPPQKTNLFNRGKQVLQDFKGFRSQQAKKQAELLGEQAQIVLIDLDSKILLSKTAAAEAKVVQKAIAENEKKIQSILKKIKTARETGTAIPPGELQKLAQKAQDLTTLIGEDKARLGQLKDAAQKGDSLNPLAQKLRASSEKASTIASQKNIGKKDVEALSEFNYQTSQTLKMLGQKPKNNLFGDLSLEMPKLAKQAFELVKGFLAFQGINFVQQQLQQIAVKAFETSMRFEALEKSLMFSSGGVSEGAASLAFVRKEVERLSLPLETSIKSFGALTAAARGTSLEGAQTEKIFTAIAQASRVYNLSAEQTEGALLAVQQMISKGCYDSETQVLTDTGWTYWEEVTPNHKFATIDLKTKQVSYQSPTRLICYWHTGKMLRVASNYVDLLVTPDHRMVVREPENPAELTIIRANDLEDKPYFYLVGEEAEEVLVLPEHLTWIDFDGKVFCAEVPNTTLYVKRNDTKCISGNSVNSEELRQQLGERLSGTFQIFARGMSVTTAELSKLLEQGKVGLDDLRKFADQLEKETRDGVTDATKTSAAALQRLQNQITDFNRNIGDAISPAVIVAFNGLASSLNFVQKNSKLVRAAVIGLAGATALIMLPSILAVGGALVTLATVTLPLATTAMLTFVAANPLALAAVAGVTVGLLAATEGAEQLANALHGVNDAQLDQVDADISFDNKFAQGQQQLLKQVPLTKEKLDELTNGLEDQAKRGVRSAKSSQYFIDQLKRMQLQAEATSKAQDALNKAVTDSELAFKKGKSQAEQIKFKADLSTYQSQAKGQISDEKLKDKEYEAEKVQNINLATVYNSRIQQIKLFLKQSQDLKKVGKKGLEAKQEKELNEELLNVQKEYSQVRINLFKSEAARNKEVLERRLKDFDEAEQIQESYRKSGLVNEQQAIEALLTIRQSKAAVELTQIAEKRKKLNKTDKEGLEVLAVQEAAVLAKMAENRKSRFDEQFNLVKGATDRATAYLEAKRKRGLTSEQQAAVQSVALATESANAQIMLIRQKLAETPKTDTAARDDLLVQEQQALAQVAEARKTAHGNFLNEVKSKEEFELAIITAARSQGVLTEQEYNQQQYNEKNKALDEQVRLIQERRGEINAADIEGQRELDKAEAETYRQRAENQKAFLDSQLQQLEKSQQKAKDTVAESVKERELEIQKLVNARVLNQEEAQAYLTQVTKDNITEELRAEAEKFRKLQSLQYTDPVAEEERQTKIRQSRIRTNELTLQLLQNEKQQQESTFAAISKAYERVNQNIANGATRFIQPLERQLQLSNALEKSFDIQNKLLDARKGLYNALQNYVNADLQILQDTAKTESEKKQLAEAAASAKLAAARLQADIDKQSLELQIKQTEAAQRRLEVENAIAIIKNKADIAQKKANLAKVKVDPNATSEQIDAAQLDLEASMMEGLGLEEQKKILGTERGANDQINNMRRQTQQLESDANIRKADYERANALADEGERNKALETLRKQSARRLFGTEDYQGKVEDYNKGNRGYALTPLQDYFASQVRNALVPVLPEIILPQVEVNNAFSGHVDSFGTAVNTLMEFVNTKLKSPTQVTISAPITNNIDSRQTAKAATDVTAEFRKQLYDLGLELNRK